MSVAKETLLPDFDGIKRNQQHVWESGDYSRVGVTFQISGEELCEAMDLHAGQSVLDVAAGNGNVSLAAARRFCKIVSTDYVQSLLDQSKLRSEVEGLSVDYRPADAEYLPFTDNCFDNVVSAFGVMFAPNQEKAANELLRVCRSGGKIGLANWTSEGFMGQFLAILSRYVPPPFGIGAPGEWATEEFLHRHFGDAAWTISTSLKQFYFRYHSPGHWFDVFGSYYGPLVKAMESLEIEAALALRRETLSLIDTFNVASDGTIVVPSDYSQTVIQLI